jgi:tetratricopeptide (TPR) repeat protein
VVNFKQSLGAFAILSLLCLTLFGCDQQNAQELFKEGTQKDAKGDWNGAIADYSRVIQLQPNNCAAYADRGRAEFMLGRLSEAMADFSHALEINPKDDYALARRALILEGQ